MIVLATCTNVMTPDHHILSLQIASSSLPTQHLFHEIRLFSQRTAQATHINIPMLNSLGHSVAIPPTTGGSNDGARLDICFVALSELINRLYLGTRVFLTSTFLSSCAHSTK